VVAAALDLWGGQGSGDGWRCGRAVCEDVGCMPLASVRRHPAATSITIQVLS
jgi:hypothetical protein